MTTLIRYLIIIMIITATPTTTTTVVVVVIKSGHTGTERNEGSASLLLVPV